MDKTELTNAARPDDSAAFDDLAGALLQAARPGGHRGRVKPA